MSKIKKNRQIYNKKKYQHMSKIKNYNIKYSQKVHLYNNFELRQIKRVVHMIKKINNLHNKIKKWIIQILSNSLFKKKFSNYKSTKIYKFKKKFKNKMKKISYLKKIN